MRNQDEDTTTNNKNVYLPDPPTRAHHAKYTEIK